MGRAFNRLLPLVKALVLLVSVAAAIPTANNLYYSWLHDIPFNQVSHRLAQYDLWMKNLECKIEYRALSNANGSKIDVGACPKSGDIAIKVSGPLGQAAYEWIEFDRLQKPLRQADGVLGLFAGRALAEETSNLASRVQPGRLRVAQAGMEVMCQIKRADKIVRIIKEDGKCFRETVSPIKGSIEKREEVSCTTQC